MDPMTHPGGPVVVSFAGPERQRRATVAFRFVLAIPHFVWGGIVAFVATLAVIAGWFAALALGRLPSGIATFVGRAVQYFTRVQGYGYMLLTDRYPPFALDRDHVISLSVAPTRLNRAAVLFRAVLMVPAYLVTSVLGSGYFVVGFFVWLIVLVKGRMPSTIFQANAAILRYQARFYAYAAMLTAEYPRGLFGDPSAPVPSAPAPMAPPPPPEHTAEGAVRAAPPPPPPPPPPSAPAPTVPADAPADAGSPRITRLVLERGAKRLVVVVIVIGALFWVGSTAASTITAIESARTLSALEKSYDELLDASVRHQSDLQGCAVIGGGLPCVRDATARLHDALVDFRSDLRDRSFPAHSVDAARDLEDTLSEAIVVADRLTTTTDPGEFQELGTRFHLLAIRIDEEYAELRTLLSF